jgi:hypothetical protein
MSGEGTVKEEHAEGWERAGLSHPTRQRRFQREGSWLRDRAAAEGLDNEGVS